MLRKFAAAQVIEAKIARPGGRLLKGAHRHTFHYEPQPGMLYVRSRAISSRTNDNYDNFPAEEIKKAYRTFIGKPVFVNHHNHDHRRARGVIIDAALHEDRTPAGHDDTWVEVLMEVDAIKFPKLAQAIVAGEIDRTSMGTDVKFSVCSACGNKASTPLEYCQHIPTMKGMKVHRVTASGEKEAVLVYEACYGLSFFENSLLVEEPADPTAYFLGVDDRGLSMMASKRKRSLNETRVPPRVDTLRDEKCPVCSETSSYDGERCLICGYITPPDFLTDPDTNAASEFHEEQQAEEIMATEEAATDDNDFEAIEDETDNSPEAEDTTPDDADEEASDPEDSDEADEDNDEEEDDDDDLPWDKKSSYTRGEHMGPVLKSLARYEQMIEAQNRQIDAQNRQIALLSRHVKGTGAPQSGRPWVPAQGERVVVEGGRRGTVMGRSKTVGHYAVKLANGPVIERSRWQLRRLAEENPGTPEGWAVDNEEAPAKGAPFTEGETRAPDGTDDPEAVGNSPVTDVSADGVDDPTTLGASPVTDVSADEVTDVTDVVAGTDPEDEDTRTEVDVTAESLNSLDTSVMFPLEDNFTAMRLARLRIQAGIATGDDLVLSQQIIASKELTKREAHREIETLTKVIESRGRRPEATRRLAGRAVPAGRAPSLNDGHLPIQSMASGPDDDEFLFE